jgi:hypothetical protein
VHGLVRRADEPRTECVRHPPIKDDPIVGTAAGAWRRMDKGVWRSLFSRHRTRKPPSR